MKKEKLRLSVDSDELKKEGSSTTTVKTDDLTWTLHAIVKKVSGESNEVGVRLECGPTDKSMIYKFNALVRFYSKCGNKRKPVMKRWKDSLTDEDPQTNNLSHNFVLNTSDFDSNTDLSFSVDINCQILACYANLPSFEFKDENLTDFKLIVGNKTFYVGKIILALRSQYIYTRLYEGEYWTDGKKLICERSHEELNHLVIDDVEPELFHKFLGMMLGYKISSIKEDEFINFVELSHKFLSDKCLQECEVAYFKMEIRAREKQRLAAEKSDLVKKFLEKLNEKWENGMLMKATSDVYEQYNFPVRDFERTILIGGVPFIVERAFSKNSKYQRLGFECMHEDASDIWQYNATIKYTNEHKQEQAPMSFTAFHPTCSAVIPCVDRFGIKLDSSWGIYKDRKHSFDKQIDNLTDVVLSVPRKKFHVSKQILATASTYFYSMFYSGFNEKNQSEVKLKDVDSADLGEFLRHVYNPKRVVKEKDREGLLELSQFFDAPAIRSKCDRFMNKEIESAFRFASMKAEKSRKRKFKKEEEETEEGETVDLLETETEEETKANVVITKEYMARKAALFEELMNPLRYENQQGIKRLRR